MYFGPCRSAVDAELQAAVAQQAADCKQQLTSSTADVEAILGRLSDERVMQLEEPDVHKVQHVLAKASCVQS